jgi:hypothetical protein
MVSFYLIADAGLQGGWLPMWKNIVEVLFILVRL